MVWHNISSSNWFIYLFFLIKGNLNWKTDTFVTSKYQSHLFTVWDFTFLKKDNTHLHRVGATEKNEILKGKENLTLD